SHKRRAWMPAMSLSTSVRIPRRSRVGLRRVLISSELSRRGASTWARPAMATCWNSMRQAIQAQELDRIAAYGHSRPCAPSSFSCGSAPAAPHRPALLAVVGAIQRADAVGGQAGRLVAGQGLEFVADLRLAAFIRAEAILDRDIDLAALLAVAR